MGYKTILSIDGGGIRGVIPARILVEIEKRAQKPARELFDLIAGTSTGGIIAIGLTATGRPRGQGPMAAEDLLSLYVDRGREIFDRSFWDGVTSIGGLSDETYDQAPLEEILKELLGDAELKDTTVDILVTSYDIEARTPYLFKTLRARSDDGRNHLLRHAARATSAAPTYFEPLLLDREAWAGEGHNRRSLVDGGVFANNPGMMAFAEGLASGSTASDMTLLSLGTGVNTRRIPHEKATGWGKVGWAVPAISVMMDGVSDAVDFQLRQIFDATARPYLRLNDTLDRANDDMDDASRANIDALLREADDILRDNDREIDDMVEKLLARGTT